MTEDIRPFEHKHRWLVEVGDIAITETCRCGKTRTRAKSSNEYIPADYYSRKRQPLPNTGHGKRSQNRHRM